MRLIDGDDLKKRLRNEYERTYTEYIHAREEDKAEYGAAAITWLYAVNCVERALTLNADVVPVVHCKDCKNWNNGDCYRQELTRPNDFCSYAERKTE